MVHRQQEVIGIYFTYNKKVNLAVCKLPGVKWSGSKKCWYVPMTQPAYKQISDNLSPLALIDNVALKIYLKKRKLLKATVPGNKRNGASGCSISSVEAL